MNNKLSKLVRIKRSALAGLACLAASAPAFGNIIGSDVVNGDGTVTYSYIVDNLGGSFDVAAWSLEFGFPAPDWNQLDNFSGGGVTVPNENWFADAGIPVTAQTAQDFLSLAPDGDVAAGHSLAGFSFTSKFLPGTVDYSEFSADGRSISGTTIGPVSSVPEGNGPFEALAFGAVVAIGAGTRIWRRK